MMMHGVLFDWMMITGDEVEHHDTLIEVIKVWVTIRGHSFAKLVLEQYKQETKKPQIKVKVLELNYLQTSYS